MILLGRRSVSVGISRGSKLLIGALVLALVGGIAVVANFDSVSYTHLTLPTKA